MIFAFLFRVVAFDKVSTPGAQPGWYFEGSQRSRGEWIAPTQADGRCSIAARKSVHSLVFLVVGEKGQEPLHTPKKNLVSM
jgi:hypothetical protein